MLVQFTKLNIWKIFALFFLLLFFPSSWAVETECDISSQFGVYQPDFIINKSQFAIAEKLRAYLRSDMSKIGKSRRSYFINRLYRGYCVGFTSLWLYSKWLLIQKPELSVSFIGPSYFDTNLINSFSGIKNENWFWSTIELVLNWDGKRKLNYEEITDIDNFIKLLDFLQVSEKYDASINPGELNKTINVNRKYPIKKEYAIGSLFTLEEFKNLLKVEDFIREGRLVFITSHNHASGLFKLNDYYYYYSANESVGEYVTKSLDDLAAAIFIANGFEKNSPSPIGIRIFYFDQETKPYLSPGELLKRVIHDFVPKADYANNYSALTIAAEIGSVESVRFLLSLEKVDPNAINDEGNTAFIIASGYGYTDIVKMLLEDERVNVNIANKFSCTALILAICFGRIDVVKELLEDKYHRVDINAVDDSGWTALRHAKHYGRQDIVEMLLSYKA